MKNLFHIRKGYLDTEETLSRIKSSGWNTFFVFCYAVLLFGLFKGYGLILLLVSAIVWFKYGRRKFAGDGFYIMLPVKPNVLVTESHSEVCYSDTHEKIVPDRNDLHAAVLERAEKPKPDQHIRIIELDTMGPVPELKAVNISREEPPDDAAQRPFIDIVRLFAQ